MQAHSPDRFALKVSRAVLPSGILHDATILIEQGKIADVYSSVPHLDVPQTFILEDAILLPGFIDLHVHGGGGWRLGIQDDHGTKPVSEIGRFLARTGVTSFLPTVATTSDAKMASAVRQVADLVGKDYGGAEVLGSHLEGPYLNPEMKGAMRKELFRDPSEEHFMPFWEASEGTISYLTLAPERDGALKFVKTLCNLGVVVSAGHTNARATEMEAAFQSGISVVTHLFNAMRGIHHREPGVVGAALANPHVWVELIGDGIHVHPSVMRLAIRAKGNDRVAIITDGGSFTGHPDGTFEEGERVVTVKDGKVTLPDGTLAGSASPMNRNCTVLVEKVGMSWSEIAQITSANPAALLGIANRKGSLEAGKDADLVALSTNGDVVLTVVRGQVVYQKGESEPFNGHHVNT
jgi:N-acetylglucosamine-6-phosphate deacetylase